MIDTTEILGPTGRIAARLPNYEQRPQQLEMAQAVAAALEARQHLIVEAGTGVGKSFAYLVPAILAATAEPPSDDQPADESDENPDTRPLAPGSARGSRRNPTPHNEPAAPKPVRRIVVSTHTIALQEQLIQKDIPLLRSVMPQEFTAVLVKGRGNYLSRRRLKSAQERAISLFNADEETDQLSQLGRWSKETTDGSLADLSFRPIAGVWDEVASDSSNCMGKSCPTHESCFYYQARRRAAHAQILVVNHALFFSDLALRRAGASILPHYDAVILDEAHTIESVAGDHLGLGISSGAIEYTLNKLYNDRTNRGLLVHYKLGNAQQEVERCRVRADDFFGDLNRWLDDQPAANGRVTAVDIVPNLLSPALDRLSRLVRQHGDKIKDNNERFDFTSAADRLHALAAEIETWIKHDLPDSVYWIERTKGRRGQTRIVLCAAPIDVGPALREHLFDAVPSVIMTSATLAIGASRVARPESAKGVKNPTPHSALPSPAPSFHYFQTRVGLTAANSLRLGSPFDYQRQAELILVDGMPDPARKTTVPSGLPRNDPSLRRPHRRPRLRPVHQLRHAPPNRLGPHPVARAAQSGSPLASRWYAAQPNARSFPRQSAQRVARAPIASGKASMFPAMRCKT